VAPTPGNRRQNAANRRAQPVADPLKPHGKEWTRVNPNHVAVDPMSVAGYNHDTVVHYPSNFGNGVKQPMQYFMTSFPMQHLPEIIDATNQNIISDVPRRQNLQGHSAVKLLDMNRFFKWIGIKLVMALEPIRGGVDACFRESPRPGSIETVGHYGSRFGMSVTDFKHIGQYIKFSDFADVDLLQVRTTIEIK
jgi:hypothetical protein